MANVITAAFINIEAAVLGVVVITGETVFTLALLGGEGMPI